MFWARWGAPRSTDRRSALAARALDRAGLCRVGNGFSATKKFRNAKVNPRVTFLIDEVLPPWRPRAVMIYGLATTLEGGADREAMTRFLQRVISWGLDDVRSG